MGGRDRSRSPKHRERSPKRSRDRDHSSERESKSVRSRDRDKDSHRRHKHRDSSEERDTRRAKSRSEDEGHSKSSRETSEERRKRKEEKKRLKKEKKEYEAKLNELLGYSNTSNPYGDGNLNEKFQWHKKRELEEKVLGLNEEEAMKRDLQRRKETMAELEKLKKRREEREIEHSLHEQELARQQREREREAYGDLEARENEFHLKQAKTRAQIRIREGRAKPIDILAMSMNLDYVDVAIALEEPYTIFLNLTLPEVEELKRDIQLYMELAKDSDTEFWENMLVVCQDELDKLRAKDDPNARTGQGVHDAVSKDIAAMLNNKTTGQLSQLQTSVVQKLASGQPVDVEYWETLLKALVVYKAKAKLREMHQIVLRQRLEQLRAKQREEAMQAQDMLAAAIVSEFPASPSQLAVPDGGEIMDLGDEEEEQAGQEPKAEEEDVERPQSPALLREILDPSIPVIEEADDLQQMAEKRAAVTGNSFIPLTIRAPAAQQQRIFADNMDMTTEERMVRLEAAKEAEEDEEEYNVEVPLERQVYMWQDKFRPRKPRYFNRVHTGYEWNKYNQTHYTHESPPPKVVQGYKFHIFYPDLINKSDTPTFKLLPDPENPDGSTCFIKFTAGPPYEDIAFRIINREWEQSHKKGFKSTFDRGILYLHFHFIRYRYRK